MINLKLTKNEMNAVVAVIDFFERVCADATPEPDNLTPQKQELFKQLGKVLHKIDKAV